MRGKCVVIAIVLYAVSAVAGNLGYVAYITADQLHLLDNPGGKIVGVIERDELTETPMIVDESGHEFIEIVYKSHTYWVHRTEVKVSTGRLGLSPLDRSPCIPGGPRGVDCDGRRQ